VEEPVEDPRYKIMFRKSMQELLATREKIKAVDDET